MKLIQVHVHALKQDMSAADIGKNIFVVISILLHPPKATLGVLDENRSSVSPCAS